MISQCAYKKNPEAHGAIGADNSVSGTHEYLPVPLTELQINTKIKRIAGY
ncbi:MAG TPA: hypothetical protein VFX43_03055 [Chitinophagaceae bacterium]|nr:hypothetical protein [Chitinophagaceae bacterium]